MAKGKTIQVDTVKEALKLALRKRGLIEIVPIIDLFLDQVSTMPETVAGEMVEKIVNEYNDEGEENGPTHVLNSQQFRQCVDERIVAEADKMVEGIRTIGREKAKITEWRVEPIEKANNSATR